MTDSVRWAEEAYARLQGAAQVEAEKPPMTREQEAIEQKRARMAHAREVRLKKRLPKGIA